MSSPLDTPARFRRLLLVVLAAAASQRPSHAVDLMAVLPGPANAAVGRFSAATGAPLRNFVAPGAGGLNSPGAMTFGRDGKLYVADGNLGVLRFDGVTGAFDK